MLYSLVPILSIYAGWRIEKFWLLLLINFIIGIPIGIVFSVTKTGWAGWIVGVGVQVAISLFLVRYFAIRYNEELTGTPTL